MKRIGISILLVVFVISVFSVFGFAKSVTVGCVAMNMAADSNVAAVAGLKKYSEEHGWKLFVEDAACSTSKLSELMMNFVTQRVDAIVVICGEAPIIEMGVESADKVGIPVFLEDTENIRDTIVNGTSNCWAMGALLASHTVDRLRAIHGGKDKIKNVCIIGMPDLYVHRQRVDTMKAVFNSGENPDINLLAEQGVELSNWQTAPYDIVRTWIARYGNKIDAILGSWDGISWGISRAISDSGYTKDDIFTMSIDGSEQTYDLIRRGEPFVGVVAQNFAGWSKVVGDAIQAVVVEGKNPKDVVPVSRTVYVPYVWVDATNVPPKGKASLIFEK